MKLLGWINYPGYEALLEIYNKQVDTRKKIELNVLKIHEKLCTDRTPMKFILNNNEKKKFKGLQ